MTQVSAARAGRMENRLRSGDRVTRPMSSAACASVTPPGRRQSRNLTRSVRGSHVTWGGCAFWKRRSSSAGLGA